MMWRGHCAVLEDVLKTRRTSNHKAPPLVGGVAEYSILPLATLQLLAGVLYSNALSVQYFGSLLQRLLAARLAKVCMSDSNASYPLKYDCEPNLAVASAFALSLAVCWPGASLSA